MPSASRLPRRRVVFTLAPLMALLFLWLGFTVAAGAVSGGPGSGAFGEDMDVYLAAAHIASHGGNPYDNSALYRAEIRLLNAQGLRVVEPRTLVRIGNPPLFFWALGPFTRLPLRAAVFLWVICAAAAAVAGFAGALRSTGRRLRAIPLLVFVTMPFVIQGVLYGEVTPMYFGGIGIGLALARRRPLPAGIVLGVAWLKPTMALPLVLLVVVFYARNPLRAAAGFLGVTAMMFAATLLTVGWSGLTRWIEGLLSFSHGIAAQPGLVSLTGFYVRSAPSTLRVGLEIGTVLTALLVTGLWWRRHPGAPTMPLQSAWLWPMWMLATPYAHYPDEAVLAVPALALLVRGGEWVLNRWGVMVLYLGALSLWFSLSSQWPIQLTPLVPVATALCCGAAYLTTSRRSPTTRAFTANPATVPDPPVT